MRHGCLPGRAVGFLPDLFSAQVKGKYIRLFFYHAGGVEISSCNGNGTIAFAQARDRPQPFWSVFRPIFQQSCFFRLVGTVCAVKAGPFAFCLRQSHAPYKIKDNDTD
jgi:hypothetical protein